MPCNVGVIRRLEHCLFCKSFWPNAISYNFLVIRASHLSNAISSIFAAWMRIAVFFLCLIFLLPVGHANGFKGTWSHSTSSTRSIKIADPFKSTHKDQSSISKNNTGGEEKSLFCEEADDEDSSEASPRKYRSPASLHSIPFYEPVLTYHLDCPTKLPFFWYQPSYRYILQRTFRIWFPPYSPVCCVHRPCLVDLSLTLFLLPVFF